MKKNRLLIIVLHRVFVISFWFLIAFGLITTARDFYNEEIIISGWHNLPVYDPIALPVKVHLAVPDSVVRYEVLDSLGNSISSGNRRYSKIELPNQELDQWSDSISRLPNVKKHFWHNEVTIYKDTPEGVHTPQKGPLQHTRSDITAFGTVYAKSSDSWLNVLMQLSNKLNLILTILILYQLKCIFFSLKKSFSFEPKIATRVKWLGMILIASEIFSASRSYFLTKFNDYIMLESFDNGKWMKSIIDININPTITFEWSIFIVGFSLLVLSSLLQLGNSIEAENELTI
ncbi:MAG: DUF2975 domain-containing protein [Cytophagales bacterium]|nr:DUF2975 domain-containing protein [Cytophagales bacterium]